MLTREKRVHRRDAESAEISQRKTFYYLCAAAACEAHHRPSCALCVSAVNLSLYKKIERLRTSDYLRVASASNVVAAARSRLFPGSSLRAARQ